MGGYDPVFGCVHPGVQENLERGARALCPRFRGMSSFRLQVIT